MCNEITKEVTGKIKWFNQYKGYGFVEIEGISEDVFLHFSVVDESNIKNLVKNDVVVCTIRQSPKGYQIIKIKEVISHSKFPVSNETKKVSAVMKWFNPSKGFGFAQLDTGEDVFIHASLLRKLFIKDIEPNQRITLLIHHTNLGYEAIDIIR